MADEPPILPAHMAQTVQAIARLATVEISLDPSLFLPLR